MYIKMGEEDGENETKEHIYTYFGAIKKIQIEIISIQIYMQGYVLREINRKK